MILYTVKKGDTLTSIAYRYQTTIAILMGDNPEIKDKNTITAGQKMRIRTAEEYAADTVKSAKKTATAASTIKIDASPNTTGMKKTESKIAWEGLTIKENQIGVVTFVRNSSLYTFDDKGNLKTLRAVNSGDRYRAYGTLSINGGLVSVGGSYAKQSDVTFAALPSEYQVNDDSVGSVVVSGNQATRTANTVRVGDKTSDKSPKDAQIPQFELPGYRRTRMQVKKKDGKTLVMELRLTNFATSYSNHYSPSRTNAGWAVHVGGKNLTTLNMSGFLLDTKTNQEAEDFLQNYNSQFTPRNSEKYFSAALVTLVHKNREYKGLIVGVSLSDQSDTPLDRKFSIQFMVMKEKSLTMSQANDNYNYTIERKGQGEIAFMSSLGNMLKNPITGK